MRLFAELKRRHVIRMAGLYLVGAWLAVQIAETLLPIFGTPAWVLQTLVVLLALGFVPALVFAWVFELTPDGIRRDRGASAAAGGAIDHTARRLDIAVIVLLLAMGATMAWQAARTTPEPASVADPGAVAGGEPQDGDNAPASIAVLPFVNMSADVENGYFADGISEELLNVLARIDGLTVASRTSSFSFKGKDTPIPEIARALGVGHVLEGSVRRQGQRVRITAQLIRAGTDSHLWSDTWDRDVTDIFVVQQEIAQAIADALVGRLPLAAAVQVPVASADPDAYERFLRGRSRFHQRRELPEAIADLEAAVARDPDFGEAWLYLAATQFVVSGYVRDIGQGRRLDAATAALEKARIWQPGHPLVVALEGALAGEQTDMVRSLDALERAAALRSTDSSPKMWHGMMLLRAGYVAEAARVLEKARQDDPMAGINHGYLALAQLASGDIATAEATAIAAQGLGWRPAMGLVATEWVRRGDRDRARRLLMRLATPDGTYDPSFQPYFTAVDRTLSASAFLAEFPDAGSFEPLLALGEDGAMLEQWQAALDDPARSDMSRWMLRSAWLPSTSAVREDPRFFEIARRLGLVDLWEKRGYPPGCTRVDSDGRPRLACPGMAP